MGWVLAGLIAFILVLLGKIILDLKKLHEAGAHDGPPAATTDGIAALQGAFLLIQQLNTRDSKPTKAECQQLKDLYEAAQAGNVSALSLEPLRNTIDLLCD